MSRILDFTRSIIQIHAVCLLLNFEKETDRCQLMAWAQTSLPLFLLQPIALVPGENILVAAQTTGFPSEGILAMSVLPFHDSTGTGTVTDFEVSNFTAGVVSRGGRDGSSAWFSRVDSKT